MKYQKNKAKSIIAENGSLVDFYISFNIQIKLGFRLFRILH